MQTKVRCQFLVLALLCPRVASQLCNDQSNRGEHENRLLNLKEKLATMEAEGSSSGNVGSAKPTTMKAVVYSKFGAPKEILETRADVPVPIVKRNQVLIRVHAAAINPVDWKMAEGYFAMINSRFPFIPGFDVSGVVIEAGAGVKDFKVGDEVFAMADYSDCGAFAEYLAIHVKYVAPKPKVFNHVEAASIPLVGLTTYQALVEHGKLASGQKILIIGGSSGTGSIGVQLAKHIGAEVTAVCSGKNVEFVQGLGASRVIDYTQEDWAEVLKGQQFDVIYDCVGGQEYWAKAQQVLKSNGRFVTIAGDKQEPITIGKVLSVAGSIINRNFWAFVSDSPYYELVLCKAVGKQLAVISKLIDEGAIQPFVSHVYSFDEVQEMFAESMTGRARGKLVLGVIAEGEQNTEEERQVAVEEVQGKGKDKEPEEETKEKEPEEEPQQQEAKEEEGETTAAPEEQHKEEL